MTLSVVRRSRCQSSSNTNRRSLRTPLLCLLGITTLSVLGCCTHVVLGQEQQAAAAVNESASDSSSQMMNDDFFITYYQISWDADIFHLPADVSFPGAGWLQRIVASNNENGAGFVFQGKEYSSSYAAMLDNRPLDFPCRNMNAYLNSIVFPPVAADWISNLIMNIGTTKTETHVRLDIAHYILCYLRNFFMGAIVYYGTALLFHYFCYVAPQSKQIFEQQGRIRPTWATIWDQIQLAQASLIIYVLLPCIDEWLVETGYTKVYYTIDEIGGLSYYLLYMVLYFSVVEIGIYWMHRTLHTNKTLYKYIHQMHHKYNKPETLTPWASIAFHPVDGMLQASPYVVTLFFVPCHYLTHFGLLFFTAIWATYIHDSMDFNVWEIMGSKYHTVHHTHYIYNYGQVFTFCDKFWGTFREPAGPTGVELKNVPRVKPNLSGRVGKKVE